MSEAAKQINFQTSRAEMLLSTIPIENIRSISVTEYHRMAEMGILNPEESLELIDGVMQKMGPIGPEHATVVDNLTNLLPRLVGNQARVRVQNPIVLNDNTEPEPDVAVVKPREGGYPTAHPRPDDVLLVIEVSEATLHYDRNVKMPRYAAAGIPEMWLIDLANNTLEVYRHPVSRPNGASTYRQRTHYYGGDTVEILMLPEIKLTVAEILLI